MKLKKTAAAFLASLMICGCALPVCAEETAETEYNEITGEEYDPNAEDAYIKSADGLYEYSASEGEDGLQYATLEKYCGTETSVVIPSEIDGITVKGLGDYTFYLNQTITDVTIPETLEDLGYFPFYGCVSMQEFKADENNEIYTADENGILLAKDGGVIWAYPAGLKQEEYTIPDGVAAINHSAFAANPYLKKITIPEGVEYMGLYAFAECSALEEIVFPKSLTEISKFGFSACTSLKKVEFTETLQVIGEAAFFDCKNLETVYFPESVTEIKQAAFVSTGFTQIEIPATVTNIGYSAFGFETDLSDQIIAMDEFTIYGYENSYAQTYCTEHNVEFVSVDEDVEEPTGEYGDTPEEASDKEEKDSIVKIIAVVLCIAAAAVCIAVAVIINVKGRKKSDDIDAAEDSDRNENDIDDENGDTEENDNSEEVDGE